VLFVRVTWIALPVSFVALVNSAAHGGQLRLCVAVVLWAGWAIGLLAALVSTTVSLTVGRLLAPLAPLTAVLAGIAGVPAWRLLFAATLAILALAAWFRAETGIACAQGSAYGDEQRFPLKAPVPMIVPMVVTWAWCAAFGVIAVIAVGGHRWLIGLASAAIAGLSIWFSGPRFHQLSRRWFVVVPVGVVVHDPTLLAENALFRKGQLAALHLAPVGTQAADLTGGTGGVRVEIVLSEPDTITKIATREHPTGVALHVLSVLVSPTRPGRALAAAAARNMPVG
jgi:hypothetical protein